MSKQSRYQSVVARQSDEPFSENHWLHEFENTLQKSSVQPCGRSVFEEIASIMNSKSKYPSVQAAVDDMMHRSGLTTYLEAVKESQDKIPNLTAAKTAQLHQEPHHSPKALDIPGLKKTLDNIVKDTKGNLPISAIIRRLQVLHSKDAPDESVWDDEDLLRLVSQCNLEAKTNNPAIFDNYDSLGKSDHSQDADLDPSNTDAFSILMPAKL